MAPETVISGRVFNLQRFSTKDGPGIRTTVFLKGCNLNCCWCHNPESIDARFELKYVQPNCIYCGECAAICPESAIAVDQNSWVLNESRCTLCGECVRACRNGALGLWGQDYHPEELVDILLKDRDYYVDSGGGVTFSGGEPLLQASFLTACMVLLKEAGIHIAIDSALNVKWNIIKKVLSLTDLLLIDVKGVNPVSHLENTSVNPELIHANIDRLKGLKDGPAIHVRIPLVRGLNDDSDQLPLLVDLLSNWPALERVELLPYHNLGAEKSRQLVSCNSQDSYQAPSEELIRKFETTLEKAALPVMKLLP